MKTKTQYLSTSKIAEKYKKTPKEMFNTLLELQLIERREEKWVLTKKGESDGGITKKHSKLGEYIAWEVERIETVLENFNDTNLLNATSLSLHFGVSKFKINPILSEIGFIEKAEKGWKVTKLGENVGGKQFNYDRTGIPYVNWNKSILTNNTLIKTIDELNGTSTVTREDDQTCSQESYVTFRDKYEANFRTTDGHYVRSRGEMLIDNWLYMYEIVHAYERKLPVEEEVYCDFYLPSGKVYIEYWGLESDERYRKRKEVKKDIYTKYGFNLIEINDNEIMNIDDTLPKKLLEFGIKTY